VRPGGAAPALAAAALALAACGTGGRDAPEPFAWRGAVPAGDWVRVRNLNGPVRVARAAGAEVVVTATPRVRGRGPAERVRFVAAPDAGGVTVCAVWGEDRGRCTAAEYRGGRSGRGGGLSGLFRRRAGVEVTFVVAVPAGVRVDVSTVNGRVTVADAAGEVRAKSVNGTVTVAARGGPVRAESVNGSVRARVDALAPEAALALSTVNGAVTALLPALPDADVALSTTNGRAASDFPLVLADSSRRALRGTAGRGGRALTLTSVNGGVNLLRVAAAP
jgi:hypothetical protein